MIYWSEEQLDSFIFEQEYKQMLYVKEQFEQWGSMKQKIHFFKPEIYANTREIWWCSIGFNIGTELYGKHELFERPVLVLKVFNRKTIKVIPLTSRKHEGRYYVPVTHKNITSYASITHTKTVSTKRISRKIGRIDQTQFNKIIEFYKNSL